MAIIRYKCDTCDREIEIPQNKRGMETFGRCSITDGCKGKLQQLEVLPTFLLGGLSSDVEGLNNWIPRKVLYKHNQTFPRKVWKIVHSLNTEPTIQTHVYDGGIFREITPLEINTIDKNTSEVVFDVAYNGIAQCIARSTNVTQPVSIESLSSEDDLVQLTSSNKLIFATTKTMPSQLKINWVTVSESTTNVISYDVTVNANSSILSWGGITKVLIRGKFYSLYNLDITPPVEVANGSSFFITETSEAPFNKNEYVALLTNSPFSIYDKILTKYFDLSTLVDEETALSYTLLQAGDMFVLESKLETAYPPIKLVV